MRIERDMKIGLVSLRWEGHHTPYAKLTAKGLVERGHDVFLFVPKNHKHLSEFKSIPKLNLQLLPNTIADLSPSVPVFLQQNIRQVSQFRKIFDNSDKLDIVHILTLDLLQPALLWTSLGRSVSCPIVATIHRKDPFRTFSTEDTVVTNQLRNLIRSVPRYTLDTSTAVLSAMDKIQLFFAHSPNIAERIVDTSQLIGKNSTYTIPAPTPLLPETSKTEARKKLSLDSEEPILLFFGELREEKGPDILLEAANRINSNCQLLFAGKPGIVDEQSINCFNPNPKVEIIFRFEYIPEEEVDLYFIAADAVVLPYRRKRGISGPLRRAAMANTHIMGSYPSDIGTIIEEENLGQTFDIGSSTDLTRCINTYLRYIDQYPTPDLQEYGERQGYGNVADELINIYQRII